MYQAVKVPVSAAETKGRIFESSSASQGKFIFTKIRDINLFAKFNLFINWKHLLMYSLGR